MFTMNRDAMTIPADRLADALQERIDRKNSVLDERERKYGKGRVWIGSYMENIGWPGLFGYDMNRFYSDPPFMLEQELRQRIFWLDNSLADDRSSLTISPTTGHYWDISMFGQRIRHTREGVPEFLPHPVAKSADLSLIEPLDFRKSGDMPVLLRQREALRGLSLSRYGGRISVGFPCFHRGPMDILIQIRGYENFVADAAENPEFVTRFLDFVVAERARWNRERAAFLGEEYRRDGTRIADDWVYSPFLSPGLFRGFVLPAFRKVQENEGPVKDFHSCGNIVPFAREFLAEFPAIKGLDVSGWNDFEKLDSMLDPSVSFSLAFKNAFVLTGTEEQHREKLEKIARVAKRRKVSVCAQAIVRIHDTYDEDLGRMNRFIELAREALS